MEGGFTMRCRFRCDNNKILTLILASVLFISCCCVGLSAESTPASNSTSPLKYLWAKAYYIPPETTTEESGYFSLCEGKNGKIYIGTAAYGRNSYLVEFDPITEEFKIVVDTHKLVGLPLEPTGYAAQSKIHTRNFVGPSGTIYFGSKQGYPTPDEVKTGKIATYRGGYVMTYNPETGEAKNLGMPMPIDDPRIAKHSKSIDANTDIEGEGVIDVTADEKRGLIYVITSEHSYWMLYDMKHPEKGYRLLGPKNEKEMEKRYLLGQSNTLVDRYGRATVITADYHIARYDPRTDKVTLDNLLLDGKPIPELIADQIKKYKYADGFDWRLAADGRTAYLVFLSDLRLFKIDLGGRTGRPVKGFSVGNRIQGKNPDSRGSLCIAKDGSVYSAIRIDNDTGFGRGFLHHLVKYDPRKKQMMDLGVFAVKNPEFFDFAGSSRPHHGFHTLPDGTLTPLHYILSMIVAHDGTIYATVLYPFTLLRVTPEQVQLNSKK